MKSRKSINVSTATRDLANIGALVHGETIGEFVGRAVKALAGDRKKLLDKLNGKLENK